MLRNRTIHIIAFLLPVIFLVVDDIYLITTPFNGCTVDEPFNRLAILASGIAAVDYFLELNSSIYNLFLGNMLVMSVYYPATFWILKYLFRRTRSGNPR
jgi:hypothetical protein